MSQDELYHEIIKLYDDEKLFKAYDLIQQLETPKDEEKHSQIEKIKKQVKDAKDILFEMFESKDWIQVANSNDIQTFYKQDSPLYSIKMESIIHQPILHILSVFHEIDLYPSWCPYMKSGEIITKYTNYKFLSYFEYDLPFPFTKRDMFTLGYSVDMLEEDASVLVLIHEPPKEMIEKLVNDQNVHITLSYAGFFIQYISENETKVCIMGNGNPQLDYIPNWLINYLMPSSIYYMMKHIHKTVDNLDGEHHERIKNKDVYKDIKRRLEKFNNKTKI